jgi:hypothetical protein
LSPEPHGFHAVFRRYQSLSDEYLGSLASLIPVGHDMLKLLILLLVKPRCGEILYFCPPNLVTISLLKGCF